MKKEAEIALWADRIFTGDGGFYETHFADLEQLG